MIQIACGHFWLTFKNGYTISVFNGFGSYSENQFNTNLRNKFKLDCIDSKDCEIAVIYNNEFVTNKFIDIDNDSVYGFVSSDELVDIIYKVKNID